MEEVQDTYYLCCKAAADGSVWRKIEGRRAGMGMAGGAVLGAVFGGPLGAWLGAAVGGAMGALVIHAEKSEPEFLKKLKPAERLKLYGDVKAVLRERKWKWRNKEELVTMVMSDHELKKKIIDILTQYVEPQKED